MKVNPKAAEPVRLVTTVDGKFLSFRDMVGRLHEEGVLDQALALLAVGHKQGDEPREIIKRVMGEFIGRCAGEMPATDSVAKAYSAWTGRGKT